MRVLMTVKIPTEAGNAAIKDGSLPEIIGKALDSLKAEAAYFTSEEGMRTALIFFDMADSSDIPPAAEPLSPYSAAFVHGWRQGRSGLLRPSTGGRAERLRFEAEIYAFLITAILYWPLHQCRGVP